MNHSIIFVTNQHHDEMDTTAPVAITPQPVAQYYRTPAQASIDAMTQYQSSLPRVSSALKPRADGRKKFTSEQTLQMEMLFRDNTHPSREQRLQLAAAFDVYVSFIHPSSPQHHHFIWCCWRVELTLVPPLLNINSKRSSTFFQFEQWREEHWNMVPKSSTSRPSRTQADCE